MQQRLNLEDHAYPVQSYFNAMGPDEFVQALENFAKGMGYNPEDRTCFFPVDLHEEENEPEASFGHINFWTYAGNQELDVPFDAFVSYVEQAVEAEKQIFPEKADVLEGLLSAIKSTVETLAAANRQFRLESKS